MQQPKIAANESQRLSTLIALNVLDTASEERFDRITRIARRIFSVPICLVSLVDENRQWFKSCQGLSNIETARDVSFCAHAIHGKNVFVVNDALKDKRFHDNPLVTGAPFIRFYAGFPLTIKDDYNVGALCLIDTKVREFSDNDIDILTDLGKMAVDELLMVAQNTLDPLTHISNRRGFDILAAQALSCCQRTSKEAALLFFDLDFFKEINDTFGHRQGDQFLCDFADILVKAFRESDVISRFGGDEFVVLLSFVQRKDVKLALDRFRKLIDEHNQATKFGRIATSIGVAYWVPDTDLSLQQLIDVADKAMYQEKARHHNKAL